MATFKKQNRITEYFCKAMEKKQYKEASILAETTRKSHKRLKMEKARKLAVDFKIFCIYSNING